MAGAAGVPGVGPELWLFWIIPLLCAAVCALVNTIYSGLVRKEKSGTLPEPEEEERGTGALSEGEDEVGAEEKGAEEE